MLSPVVFALSSRWSTLLERVCNSANFRGSVGIPSILSEFSHGDAVNVRCQWGEQDDSWGI